MSVDKLLSVPALFAWFTLILIPVIWPSLSDLEGKLLPVTSGIAVSNETKVEGGVSFYVSFAKNRSCEFLGLSWYRGADRLVLDFEPDADKAPASRPIRCR